MATTPIRSVNPGTVPAKISQDTHDRFVRYFQNCAGFLNNNFNLRDQFLRRDKAYYRENDLVGSSGNRAKFANAAGNSGPIQDVTIPVVMPQVETAVSFLTDIFLTGYPIFPILSKPQQSDPALQMETLVGEHSIKYGWPRELLLCFRDGLKYNLMAAEVTWQNNKTWTVDTANLSPTAQSRAVETYYQGNRIKRLNPYNLIVDTRVTEPAQAHKTAEFLGYTELMNRIQLKQLVADLGATYVMNVTKAFESGTGVYSLAGGTDQFYIPTINPAALQQPQLTTTDWGVWAGIDNKEGIRYHNMYEVSTLYARIIPDDFNIQTQARNTVQIWKMIIVNRKIVIFAERQTNAHNFIPIILGQPTEDGLAWQSKSFAENASPMQDAATSLYKSAIESQRRKVYDRIFYDPSRINKADIDNVSAVARIPVKQVAYGGDLRTAIFAHDYSDNGVADILGMSQQMVQFADTVNGQNKVSQGQFQKGNKSRKEFETVMGNSNGRMMTMALLIEYQFFQPIKEIIKLNILQFQPPTQLYNRNTTSPVNIDPVKIREAALEFKVADGLLPVDKLVNLDSLGELLQMSAGSPQILAQYDVPGMILYALQLQGAGWIKDFQRTPDQQAAFLKNTQAASGTTDATGNPVTPQPQPQQ